MNNICDNCETAIHCAKYGCIPVRIGKPAQRTWVGLTHDEYDEICDKHSAMSDFDFLEDIEAKLKEKNT